MQALVTCPSGALLQHRSANTSYRPCMAATLLPRLSTAAATVRPVSHPQLSFVLCPSSLPSHAGRSVIVPSALPSGSAHLNFLEVISTGVTPATPTYLTDKGRHHSQQLEQGLFELAGVVASEEYADIIAALQTKSAKERLSKASKEVRGFRVPHADVIAERIRQLPFFHGCMYSKPRGRLQGRGHKPSPHQDTLPYSYRVVVRFSADGHSPSYIDFYAPRIRGPSGRFRFDAGSTPAASLEVPSGQGYIMSDAIGVQGEGNIIHHDVPPSFHGVSLIIDFYESSA